MLIAIKKGVFRHGTNYRDSNFDYDDLLGINPATRYGSQAMKEPMLLQDKHFEEIKKRIRKLVIKWKPLLCLSHVNIDIEYDRSYGSDANSGAAACASNLERWEYQDFTLRFYLPMLYDYTDDRLTDTVVHELTHCLLAPITSSMHGADEGAEYYRKIMEHEVTNVARGFVYAYQAGAASVKCDSIKKVKKEK